MIKKLLIFLLLLSLTTPVFAGEVVDQQQTTADQSRNFGTAGGIVYKYAQSFQLSGALTVTTLECFRYAATTGTPTGNWTLRIETDSGSDTPSGTLADANATIAITPPAEGAAGKGTFATPCPLSATTKYWFVVQSDVQSDGNYWTLGATSPDNYANGNYARAADGVWTSVSTWDLYFKIYVQTADRRIIMTQ